MCRSGFDADPHGALAYSIAQLWCDKACRHCIHNRLKTHAACAGYTNMSAVLKVNTNHTNPFSSGSMFRRTGLEGDSMSYTDEGVGYSDPITCVVSAISSHYLLCRFRVLHSLAHHLHPRKRRLAAILRGKAPFFSPRKDKGLHYLIP